MTWDSYLRAWELHGQSARYRERFRIAVERAQEGHDAGRLFAGLSGGKDGCALAGVLAAAGLRELVPLVHCHTDLNTPGMEECAYAVAEKLDMELEVIEPERDVWQLLRELPREVSILEPENHGKLMAAIAAGNMLVAYQYEHGFDGAFSGVRAEESKGRLWNRKMRGPLYRIKKDGAVMCTPIVDWSARDVFACLVRLGLPIHPHYRLLYERFGVDPESPSSRVDCMLPEERVTTWPVALQLRELYPDLYRRLVAARPELERYT